MQRLKDNDLVSESEAMKMRWALTWKRKEDGSLKGKARLVVLGFQDPHLGTENFNHFFRELLDGHARATCIISC